MQIGFTSNSFRNIKSIEKIVAVAKSVAAECIEWSADVHVKSIDDAKKAKKLCDDAGISVCSYGSYYRVGNGETDSWRNICEIAEILSAPVIRVWLGSADSEKTDNETYDKLLSEIKQMCDTAGEYGISVCPECHDNTFNNNTDAFLRMYNDAQKENFGTYFQSRYKKYNYDMDRICRTAPYTECVHVSFFDRNREQFPRLRPSYMNGIINKLIETGYDKSIVVEFTYPGFKAGCPFFLKKEIKALRNLTD